MWPKIFQNRKLAHEGAAAAAQPTGKPVCQLQEHVGQVCIHAGGVGCRAAPSAGRPVPPQTACFCILKIKMNFCRS